MRTILGFLIALVAACFGSSSAKAEIPLKTYQVNCGVGVQEFEMVWDDADDTSGFNDRDQIGAMMNKAYRLIAAKCGTGKLMTYSITIKDVRGNVGFTATTSLYTPSQGWNYRTRMPELIRLGIQQSKANEIARKEFEARQVAARTDCGQQALISGGPWFSSTYKVAVNDEVIRYVKGSMFCIKAVEYISAAPNPMGGNAARVRFIGYDRSLKLVNYVADFAY